MIPSEDFGFTSEHAYQAFPQSFSQILSNYFFGLQCSAIDHSGNFSAENLNSWVIDFLDSSYLNVVFTSE